MPHRKTSTSKALSAVFLMAALAVASATVSKAAPVTCSNGPGCLDATASFNWATDFGAEFNPIPNGSIALSDNPALSAIVTFASGGDGQRMDQGSGWNGNFSPGDPLLWTNSPGQGPLTFTFNQLLTGLGAQIQADFQGSFTADLLAFDGQGNLIDSVSATGDSNSNGDGSAIFLGVAGDQGIRSATFQLTSCACDTSDFAIGSLNVTPVPEPGSFILMLIGFGLTALGCRNRVRTPGEVSALNQSRKGQVQ